MQISCKDSPDPFWLHVIFFELGNRSSICSLPTQHLSFCLLLFAALFLWQFVFTIRTNLVIATGAFLRPQSILEAPVAPFVSLSKFPRSIGTAAYVPRALICRQYQSSGLVYLSMPSLPRLVAVLVRKFRLTIPTYVIMAYNAFMHPKLAHFKAPLAQRVPVYKLL